MRVRDYQVENRHVLISVVVATILVALALVDRSFPSLKANLIAGSILWTLVALALIGKFARKVDE